MVNPKIFNFLNKNRLIKKKQNVSENIENNKITPEYDYLNRKRRQDIKPEEKKYFENGSIYIFTKEHFELTNNRLGGKIGYVIFPEEYVAINGRF